MSKQPRVPPIPPEEWSESAREAVAALSEPMSQVGKNPSDDTSVVPNVLRTWVNYPDLAIKYLPFSRYLLKAGRLPGRWRELLILRTAWRQGAEYEWANHVILGRREGIRDDEIRCVTKTIDSDDWGPEEFLLLTAADELIDSTQMSEETWERLGKYLDQEQLIEVATVVGNYVLLSMVFKTFGLQLDSHLVQEGFEKWR